MQGRGDAPNMMSESDVQFPVVPSRERLRRALTGPRAPPPRRRTGLSTRTVRSDIGVPPPSLAGVDLMGMRFTQSIGEPPRTEANDLVVHFDDGDGHVRESNRFVLDPMSPGGSTLPHPHHRSHSTTGVRDSKISLPRDVTLLSFGSSHARTSHELKSLLGNSNARLKSGAVIHAGHTKDKKSRKEQGVALEQAKSRARVEVDIVLESNVCVQGGHVRGHIKIRVRKRTKKEGAVYLAEGKVRVLGYEMLPGEDERHTFYQYAAPLSSVTDAASNLYGSAKDDDGFARAIEGVHVLPFALQLPPDASFGTPKGVSNTGSGALVRYIAMMSIKVRDADTGKRSIAHFYRECEVWPRLDPCTILQPAPRPLQATISRSVSLLRGSSKVKLNAQVHRLHWLAGTRCPVTINVNNGSKKTIRSLVLTLVRTTTIFRPRHLLDPTDDRDPDACQTATTHKAVATSLLEMGAGVAKGHASAKGWWTGVGPGQELGFSHFILLPTDALSITRSRLLEVEYSIRVTISAGPLTSDISVTIPIRIFNSISIDPPPSAGLLSSSGAYIRSSQLPTAVEAPDSESPPNSRITENIRRRLSITVEDENEAFAGSPPDATAVRPSSLHVTNPDVPMPSALPPSPTTISEKSVYSTYTSVQDDDGYYDTTVDADISRRSSHLGNLDVDGDMGSDDEIAAVLGSMGVEKSHFSLLNPPEKMSKRKLRDKQARQALKARLNATKNARFVNHHMANPQTADISGSEEYDDFTTHSYPGAPRHPGLARALSAPYPQRPVEEEAYMDPRLRGPRTFEGQSAPHGPRHTASELPGRAMSQRTPRDAQRIPLVPAQRAFALAQRAAMGGPPKVPGLPYTAPRGRSAGGPSGMPPTPTRSASRMLPAPPPVPAPQRPGSSGRPGSMRVPHASMRTTRTPGNHMLGMNMNTNKSVGAMPRPPRSSMKASARSHILDLRHTAESGSDSEAGHSLSAVRQRIMALEGRVNSSRPYT